MIDIYNLALLKYQLMGYDLKYPQQSPTERTLWVEFTQAVSLLRYLLIWTESGMSKSQNWEFKKCYFWKGFIIDIYNNLALLKCELMGSNLKYPQQSSTEITLWAEFTQAISSISYLPIWTANDMSKSQN